LIEFDNKSLWLPERQQCCSFRKYCRKWQIRKNLILISWPVWINHQDAIGYRIGVLSDWIISVLKK